MDGLVEGREAVDLAIRDVFVEDEREDWEARVDSRVTEDKVTVVDRDGHEEVEAGEDGLDEGDDHAAMDHELRQGSAPLV